MLDKINTLVLMRGLETKCINITRMPVLRALGYWQYMQISLKTQMNVTKYAN